MKSMMNRHHARGYQSKPIPFGAILILIILTCAMGTSALAKEPIRFDGHLVIDYGSHDVNLATSHRNIPPQ